MPQPVARLLGAVVPAASLALVVAVQVAVQLTAPVAARLPVGAARFDFAGAWLASERGALAGADAWSSTPVLGRLQLGLLLRALQAGQGTTVLAAAQTALLLVAVAQSVLLWLLLRRLGRSAAAAGLAVAVFAIAPAAVAAHATVSTAALAGVWLLAGALLVVGGGRAPGVAGGVAAAIAVATDPLALAVVVVALPALALARRAPPVRRDVPPPGVAAPVAGVAVAVVVVLAVALVQRSLSPTGAARALDALSAAQGGPAGGVAALMLWVTTDPLGVVIAVVALVVVARGPRSRALTVAAGLLLAASIWPAGASAAGPLVLLLPVVAVAVALTVDRAVVALAHPVFVRSLIGSGWLTGVAALLLVAVVVSLSGLFAVQPAAQRPVARTEQWLRGSVPAGQVVLVGLGAWPDLARSTRALVGWYAAPAASSRPWSTAGYVVADAALGDGGSAAARAVLSRSVQVARFGSGAEALTVRAVRPASAASPSPAPTAPATAAERRAQAARLAAGRQLAANPRIELDGGDRALLTSGRVDARIALVLAQFVTTRRVTVSAFGTAAGDASGVRTTVQVSAVDGARVPADAQRTGELLRFLSALRGDFATRSIDAGPGGVTAAFAPAPAWTP